MFFDEFSCPLDEFLHLKNSCGRLESCEVVAVPIRYSGCAYENRVNYEILVPLDKANCQG